MKKIVPLLCLFSLFFSSCVVRQDITLRRDGGGSLRVELEFHRFVTDYARDIRGSFSSSTEPVSLFDLESIEAFFLANQSAELLSVDNPRPASLVLEARFDDPETLFERKNPGIEPLLRVTRQGSVKTLTFTLTPENTRLLTDPVSLTENELFQVFGPQSDSPYSEDEYIDLLSYVFGDYFADEDAAIVLAGSTVRVTVRAEGGVVGVSGGELRGGTASFSIPFLDIVTMTEPLVLSVSYK